MNRKRQHQGTPVKPKYCHNPLRSSAKNRKYQMLRFFPTLIPSPLLHLGSNITSTRVQSKSISFSTLFEYNFHLLFLFLEPWRRKRLIIGMDQSPRDMLSAAKGLRSRRRILSGWLSIIEARKMKQLPRCWTLVPSRKKRKKNWSTRINKI